MDLVDRQEVSERMIPCRNISSKHDWIFGSLPVSTVGSPRGSSITSYRIDQNSARLGRMRAGIRDIKQQGKGEEGEEGEVCVCVDLRSS